jgi:hypothetical protein
MDFSMANSAIRRQAGRRWEFPVRHCGWAGIAISNLRFEISNVYGLTLGVHYSNAARNSQFSTQNSKLSTRNSMTKTAHSKLLIKNG